MTILVTGASGKSGQAVVRALKRAGATTRAFIHRQEQEPQMRALGAAEVVVGDLRDEQALAQAMRDIHAVYHICPAMQPEETEIGQRMIALAKTAGVSHFVYYSVLHPQTAALPHHTLKLHVETALVQSNLPFTILQPASYMQNILMDRARIREQGIYTTSYGLNARMSLVDLDDVGEVAAHVLTEDGHRYATYELSGPEVLTAADMADILSRVLGRPVSAENMDIDRWAQQMRTHGMSDYAVTTLATMFRYYADHGFAGNPNVLAMLLKRPPTTFAQFVAREMAQA